MPEPILRSETFPEGYRLTRTSGGLRIESVEPDPKLLELNRDKLAAFGLRCIDDHYIDVRPDQEPEGVVDKMRASQDRTAELMIRLEPKSKWGWDIENLKRIYIILGGLDEKVVQQILDEEGK